jgi:hypothetical protein
MHVRTTILNLSFCGSFNLSLSVYFLLDTLLNVNILLQMNNNTNVLKCVSSESSLCWRTRRQYIKFESEFKCIKESFCNK